MSPLIDPKDDLPLEGASAGEGRLCENTSPEASVLSKETTEGARVSDPDDAKGNPDRGERPGCALDDARPEQRPLLARLRSLDAELEANHRLICQIKEREAEAASTARSPASSPEEARATVLEARSFQAASGEKIREAGGRISGLSQERESVLERMARTGFFEGRWVNDGGRAVYLESAGTSPPSYRLYEADWAWVQNAPPGEDPRETLRRGPILQRAHHRRNQTLLLFGVPFAAYCIVEVFPPPIAHHSVAAALATVAALLLALPLAREALFGRVIPNPHSERRLIEEEAASAQLHLMTKGEKEPPSLEEITEAMLASLGKRIGHRETIQSINVVENPAKRPQDPTPPASHSTDGVGESGAEPDLNQRPPVRGPDHAAPPTDASARTAPTKETTQGEPK